ncbi:MAG: hypothetical protein K2Q01_03245 [Rickettsiales bacterium]|nr:hypothetical protein [Rickettsiales bacterium]
MFEFLDIGLADAAIGTMDTALLVPHGHSSRNHSGRQTTVPLGSAAIVGAAAGLFSNNQKQTLLFSALGGAAMPLLRPGRSTLAGITLSAVTSTAVGLVTHMAKEQWRAREHAKEDAKHFNALDAQPQR